MQRRRCRDVNAGWIMTKVFGLYFWCQDLREGNGPIPKNGQTVVVSTCFLPNTFATFFMPHAFSHSFCHTLLPHFVCHSIICHNLLPHSLCHILLPNPLRHNLICHMLFASPFCHISMPRPFLYFATHSSHNLTTTCFLPHTFCHIPVSATLHLFFFQPHTLVEKKIARFLPVFYLFFLPVLACRLTGMGSLSDTMEEYLRRGTRPRGAHSRWGHSRT